MDFHIRKGVDIRLAGTAKEEIQNFASSRFLICPTDFRWLKPRLLIAPGSSVNVGTPLFCS
ncbi:MAG: NADH:ubiquinone reductase (Na(+)-transporting) subunit A, partial [Bacteroidales bacterium]|nr:NADH:ubiquinone reductase (Na(+)-transporting) subunit A [Bacteroidales bacterium]